MALLEVKDLSTVFHTDDGPINAVDGITFTLEAGETLGLVGESGSGKSVSAFSVMRLVSAPGEVIGGEVNLAGEDLLQFDAKAIRQVRGKEISMIFQEPLSSLNPLQTIGSQVMEPLLIHFDMGRTSAQKKALAMLDRVGIPDAESRFNVYPHQLSGGLRQRVMIALALICEPKILIADEPTTALDVTIQAQILDLLKELQGELGMAIILITHDLGVIAEIADHVSVMYAGQIVESAHVDDIFYQTGHPYSAALINSIPDLTVETDRLIAVEGVMPDPKALPNGCRFAPRCNFSEPACTQTPQRLFLKGEAHRVACMRAERGELPQPLIAAAKEAGHVQSAR